MAAQIELPPDLLFGAVVAAVKEVLHESGVVDEVLQTTRTVQEMRLLKEGLLTYDQAAALLGLSRKTFGRMMEEGRKPDGSPIPPAFPKITYLGRKEPRVHLSAILAKLLSGETVEGPGKFKVSSLLHPGRKNKSAA